MSSYIPKQPKPERDQISIKLDRDVLRKLELYGRFLESSRDYIISAALDLVFRKDKAYAAWLETEKSAGDAERPTAQLIDRRATGRAGRCGHQNAAMFRARIRGPNAMRTLIENRTLLSLTPRCSIGSVLFRRFPFPVEHPLLALVLLHKPYIFGDACRRSRN